MSVSGLQLVVACDGQSINAAHVASFFPVLVGAVTDRDLAMGFSAGVFARIVNHTTSLYCLTAGHHLPDDQITQVARILTLRLSGQNPSDPENIGGWPIYVQEIVDGVKRGEKADKPDWAVAHNAMIEAEYQEGQAEAAREVLTELCDALGEEDGADCINARTQAAWEKANALLVAQTGAKSGRMIIGKPQIFDLPLQEGF